MRRSFLVPVIAALSPFACDACRGDAMPPRTTTAPTTSESAATHATNTAASVAEIAPRTIRVYVAGESIERRNRFVVAPFSADGSLTDRGELRNDDDEYGWMIPFADRLKLRDAKLTVSWVGTDSWLGADDRPYDGSYPSTKPGATSAIAGTSIDSWMQARAGELEQKKHCYDLAFAARGGNDFGLDDDAAVEASLKDLLALLVHGSSCRHDPIVLVTAHMPDDQRNGGPPGDGAYVLQQKRRYVARFKDAVDAFVGSNPKAHVHFVDLYTPFVDNRATTAFPSEQWSTSGVPDFKKIGHLGDRMHPRRLASIYVGELAADAVDLAEVRAP